MPLYEYQCTECGKKTEVLQRFEDAPPAACPACGAAVKKLVSSPSFPFQGRGWDVTDYARKGGPGASGEAGGSDKGDNAAGAEGSAAGAAAGSTADSASKAGARAGGTPGGSAPAGNDGASGNRGSGSGSEARSRSA